MVAGAEAVDVEAGADPGQGARRDDPLGAGQILFRRHLEILLLARDQQDIEPRRLGNRRVVGQFPAGQGPVCRQDRLEAKGLWCLRAPQAAAVYRCDRQAVLPALQGIDDRHGHQRRIVISQPADRRVDNPTGQEGPGGVVDQYPVGRAGGQRLEAVEHRCLAGPAAGDGRRQVQVADGAFIQIGIVRVIDDLHPVDPRVIHEGARAMAQQRLSRERPVLFRNFAGGDDKGHAAAHFACRRLLIETAARHRARAAGTVSAIAPDAKPTTARGVPRERHIVRLIVRCNITMMPKS